jgi:thiosulfate/3-mercaptopyruvate sulfurtransferase
LEGSFSHWVEAGLPIKPGIETRTPRKFSQKPDPDHFVPADELLAMRKAGEIVLIDSRAPQRYRGEVEPLDPVAGHIPGALNAFWQDNLTEYGFFKSKEELRVRFEKLLGSTPAEKAVFYCGSGVTGIHNILGVMHAGLGQARLYPGSWSGWITDPSRPISTGDKP